MNERSVGRSDRVRAKAQYTTHNKGGEKKTHRRNTKKSNRKTNRAKRHVIPKWKIAQTAIFLDKLFSDFQYVCTEICSLLFVRASECIGIEPNFGQISV